MDWPEYVASACMALYKTPREILRMTLAEIEVLSHYKPDGTKKQQTIGFLDPETSAMIRAKAYRDMPPREKIAKRMKERG